MKTPLLNSFQRYVLFEHPGTLTAAGLKIHLATSLFKREFEKSWIIQGFIKPLIIYLSRIIAVSGERYKLLTLSFRLKPEDFTRGINLQISPRAIKRRIRILRTAQMVINAAVSLTKFGTSISSFSDAMHKSVESVNEFVKNQINNEEQKLILTIDGKEIGSCSSHSIQFPDTDYESSSWDEYINSKKTWVIRGDQLKGTYQNVSLEYYMKRGKRYYFRNSLHRLSFESNGLITYLRKNGVKLKYGETYKFDYTI